MYSTTMMRRIVGNTNFFFINGCKKSMQVFQSFSHSIVNISSNDKTLSMWPLLVVISVLGSAEKLATEPALVRSQLQVDHVTMTKKTMSDPLIADFTPVLSVSVAS